MANTDQKYDELSEQITALKADIAALTGTIADLGKAEKSRLQEAAKAKGEELKARGEAHAAELKATAEGYARDGERFVREQPGTALGLAAAIGFIVGYFVTRK